jgi:hypothetical protein
LGVLPREVEGDCQEKALPDKSNKAFSIYYRTYAKVEMAIFYDNLILQGSCRE